jgi:hypothetical protein
MGIASEHLGSGVERLLGLGSPQEAVASPGKQYINPSLVTANVLARRCTDTDPDDPKDIALEHSPPR